MGFSLPENRKRIYRSCINLYGHLKKYQEREPSMELEDLLWALFRMTNRIAMDDKGKPPEVLE